MDVLEIGKEYVILNGQKLKTVTDVRLHLTPGNSKAIITLDADVIFKGGVEAKCRRHMCVADGIRELKALILKLRR